MLKDLGVDISKNTKIDKAVLEVGVGACAGRGTAVRRGAGRIRHIATPTLRAQKLTQDDNVKMWEEGGQLRLSHLTLATPSAGRGFGSDLAILGANPRRE